MVHELTSTDSGGIVVLGSDGSTLSSLTQRFGHVINAKDDHGATGDGTTDDTAALNAAAAAVTQGQTSLSIQSLAQQDTPRGTLFIPEGTYRITSTFLIPWGIDVICRGAVILYDNGNDGVAVQIGDNTNDNTGGHYENLRIWNNDGQDYTNESLVGLRIIRTTHSVFVNTTINVFTNGLQLYGDTEGQAWNRFYNTVICACKAYIDFYSVNANGYLNANTFYGGHISAVGDVAHPTVYGVRFHREPGGNNDPNDNIFMYFDFDLGNPDPGVVDRIPVYMDLGGQYNHFLHCRHEFNSGPFMVLTANASAARQNYATASYLGVTGQVMTVDQDDAIGVAFGSAISIGEVEPYRPRPFWSSGNLAQKAHSYSSNRLAIPGMHLSNGASYGVFLFTQSTTAAKIHENSIELAINEAILVFMRTDTIKTFLLEAIGDPDSNISCTGAPVVQCFDADGNILSGTSPYYCNLSSSTTHGNSYTALAREDLPLRIAVTVRSEVKYVRIGVGSLETAGGQRGVRVQSFQITGFPSGDTGQSLTVWSGLDYAEDLKVSDAAPSVGGIFAVGQPIWFSGASSGNPPGCVCTTAGRAAPAWQATTAYALGELVENDTGKIYVCRTAGTSAGSGGPTGTGTGITDNTAVWDYLSPQAAFTAMANLA